MERTTMLKNDTANVDQNSLLTWIKEKRNNLLNGETISLIKGKEKLLTSFVVFFFKTFILIIPLF